MKIRSLKLQDNKYGNQWADEVYDRISKDGLRTEKLDGDVLRGYFPPTGFSKKERDDHDGEFVSKGRRFRKVAYRHSLCERHQYPKVEGEEPENLIPMGKNKYEHKKFYQI